MTALVATMRYQPRSVALWLLFAFVAVPRVHSLLFNCPPSCDRSECPRVRCAESGGNEDDVYYDQCRCCPACYKKAYQRCGGIAGGVCRPGHTCEYRPGTVVGSPGDRRGRCEHVYCKQKSCPFRQSCLYGYDESRPFANTLICSCPDYECQDKDNPVCGHNGQTYPSVCMLQSTECAQGQFIGIKHFGHCRPVLEVKTTVPSGCSYYNHWYAKGTVTQATPFNVCLYLICDASAILYIVNVPGCGVTPPGTDYGVDKLAVHGGWSEWSDWGQCVDIGCHNSTQRRTRKCTSPRPKFEGRNCTGLSEQTRDCIPDSCRAGIHCVYSNWTDWGACSVTCDSGIRTRTRTVVSSNADERLCITTESETCHQPSCFQGRCRVLEKTITLYNNRGCRSLYPTRIKYCRGNCDAEEEPWGETYCCEPTRYYTTDDITVTNCTLSPNTYRYSIFDLVADCWCKRCQRGSPPMPDYIPVL